MDGASRIPLCMSSPAVLAAFDVDGTLTRWDTLPFFLWKIAGSTSFAWNSLAVSPTLFRYAVGEMSNAVTKEKVFVKFLGGHRVPEVEQTSHRFATETMPHLLRGEAMERLQWHKDRNHFTVLVSASLECYLRPWGKHIGVDKVIGTRLETDGKGCFTGHIVGNNCYGPEKLRRLREAIPGLNEAEIYAYGNSAGDREILDAADHAFFRTLGS